MIQLSKNNQISVIQYGLGPIGCELAKLVLDKKNLKLVGGIDVDKSKIGKDLGLVIGYNKQLGIPVVNNLDEAIKLINDRKIKKEHKGTKKKILKIKKK